MNGSSAPLPPPSSAEPSTGRLVATVAAVLAGIVVLMLAGLGMASYLFVSRIHVARTPGGRGENTAIRFETPLGSVRVDKQERVDPKLLGIPLYPGAVVVEGQAGGARVDVDLDFAGKSLRVAAVQMETPDPMEKVVSFYRSEASDFALRFESRGRAEFHSSRDGIKKVIGIAAQRGKTRISLANIGAPEAN
jgi:hypothetical protein